MATTAQSAKAAADQAADFGYDAFKTTVDRSIAAFDGIAVNSKLNLEAIADSVGAAAECAQTLSAQAAAYSKKALEDHLVTSPLVSGASILGDGTVVLILNVPAVVSQLSKLPALEAIA